MPAALATRDQRLQAVELAAVHGLRKTASALNMPLDTLKSWCYRDFRTEYSEFRAGKLSEWRQSFAAEMEDLQQDYAATEAKAIERAQELLDEEELDARDVASLIKGMGAARASATGTATRARGEPDHIEEHRLNFEAIEQAAERILAKYGPPPAITLSDDDVEELDAGPQT
jgi:hypothetical protein